MGLRGLFDGGALRVPADSASRFRSGCKLNGSPGVNLARSNACLMGTASANRFFFFSV